MAVYPINKWIGRSINDSGFITLTRLTSDEITGTESSAGIIEKYFSLSQEDTACLQDIALGAGEMKIGDKRDHRCPLRASFDRP